MRPVCDEAELPNPGAKSVPDGQYCQDTAFVVRHAQGYSAFYNRCPHTGAPLNWRPDQFLTIDQRYILCGLHGAHFRLTDGLCVRGPCIGQSLTSIPVVVKDHTIHLKL